jgi:hypothetical protein
MPRGNQGGGRWGRGGGGGDGEGHWGSGPHQSGPHRPISRSLPKRIKLSTSSARARRIGGNVLPGGNLGGKGLALIALAAIARPWNGFSGAPTRSSWPRPRVGSARGPNRAFGFAPEITNSTGLTTQSSAPMLPSRAATRWHGRRHPRRQPVLSSRIAAGAPPIS